MMKFLIFEETHKVMKKLFLLFAALGIMAGCVEDPPPPPPPPPPPTFPNTFIINGDGFSSQKFDVKTISIDSSFYYSIENKTVFYVEGANETHELSIDGYFPGSSTGTFSFSAGNAPGINMSILNKSTGDLRTYSNTQTGNVTVQQYDAEGGKVKGLFDGTFKNTSTDEPVTIASGKFQATVK